MNLVSVSRICLAILVVSVFASQATAGGLQKPEEMIDARAEALEEGLDPWLGRGLLDRAWEPVAGVQEKLSKDYELSLFAIYSPIYQVSEGGDDTLNHAADLFGFWEHLFQTDSWFGYTNVNLFALWRKDDDLDSTSEFLADSDLTVAVNDSEVGDDFHSLTLLAWEQVMFDGRAELDFGQMDPITYFDTNEFAGYDRQSFVHETLSSNPVRSIPASGLGIGGSVYPTDWVNFKYLFLDANADGEYPEFDNLGEDGWAHLGEVHFTPEIEGLGQGNYRFTIQRIQDSKPLGRSTTSWSMSFDQELGERYGAFFRYGYGDGRSTGVEEFASFGVVSRGFLGHRNDLVGVGLFWSDPEKVKRDELGAEIFWRIQVTERIQFTPDVMLIRQSKGDNKPVAIFNLRIAVYL
jgi:hypothetical protein